jgi:hypothetical protein
MIVGSNLYSQNRYSTYTPSSNYQPTSFSEYMSAYQAIYNRRNTVSCNELYQYIVKNGYKKSTIANYVMQSTWLYRVTAYEYNYKIYVVAEIKENEYSINTNSYIFCGIPNINWSNFQFGAYGDSNSYGERFHKYIKNYKCDCE